MTYTATVGLTNDKTGKRFEPGDTVKDTDFPKPVIKAWLDRGHLVEDGADGSDSNAG